MLLDKRGGGVKVDDGPQVHKSKPLVRLPYPLSTPPKECPQWSVVGVCFLLAEAKNAIPPFLWNDRTIVITRMLGMVSSSALVSSQSGRSSFRDQGRTEW